MNRKKNHINITGGAAVAYTSDETGWKANGAHPVS